MKPNIVFPSTFERWAELSPATPLIQAALVIFVVVVELVGQGSCIAME